MAVTVTAAESCTVQETLPNNTDSASDANRVVTHTQFNQSHSLNAGTAVPATQFAGQVVALVAGAKTIDLRALTGTNGAAVDGNGLKVQMFRVRNLGANNMVFAQGASNGFGLLGATFSFTLYPGACLQFYLNDATPDISATAKTIDVTGTGTQTFELTVVMG